MDRKRHKVLNGYTALARFIAELSEEPVREIEKDANIPSPYRFSPVHVVYNHPSYGEVFWVETRHRRYEVFSA